MVTEFTEIEVKPGMEQQFIVAVEDIKPIAAKMTGCHGLWLHRSIEKPAYFVLNINWDSVEAHNRMRAAPEAQIIREKFAPYFAGPPKAWHSQTVVS
jgi:quinol monooxygenase YgiN